MVNGVFWFVMGAALGAFIGYPSGVLRMKWTVAEELRATRAQNRELTENGRRLAAAAYVCMEHCGTPVCEPKAEGK